MSDSGPPNAGNLLHEVLTASGGLAGLTTRFEQCGLGETIQSWIGNGENQPITPAEIERVIPPERQDQLARTHNFPPGTISAVLAMLLPHAVDNATPDDHAD